MHLGGFRHVAIAIRRGGLVPASSETLVSWKEENKEHGNRQRIDIIIQTLSLMSSGTTDFG